MIVHIRDILRTKLASIVVNLILHSERTVDIYLILMLDKYCSHLRQGVIYQFEHLIDVIKLSLCKLFFCRTSAPNRTSYMQARVTNTLNFAYLTQHLTYLFLRVITKMSIADLVQILCNLHLHII